MSQEPKPSQEKDWIFAGFLCGVAIGWVLGCVLHGYLIVRHFPKSSIFNSGAFFALVGGLLGLSAGIIHRLARRR